MIGLVLFLIFKLLERVKKCCDERQIVEDTEKCRKRVRKKGEKNGKHLKLTKCYNHNCSKSINIYKETMFWVNLKTKSIHYIFTLLVIIWLRSRYLTTVFL